MPPPRQFGQEIAGNTQRRPNISPANRQRIIAKRECGVTVRELAAEFGQSKDAIKYTIQTYAKTGTTQERPRSGRPPILLLHQKKIIYQKAHAAPKIEYSVLAKVGVFVQPDGTTSKPPSHSTLYWMLKAAGLINHRSKKRPKLNRGHAVKRLQFCRQYQHFKWHQQTVKFSDECSVQKGSRANQEWYFRFPWEKWKPDMITAMNTSRKP
jgi:transposase-like protein